MDFFEFENIASIFWCIFKLIFIFYVIPVVVITLMPTKKKIKCSYEEAQVRINKNMERIVYLEQLIEKQEIELNKLCERQENNLFYDCNLREDIDLLKSSISVDKRHLSEIEEENKLLKKVKKK